MEKVVDIYKRPYNSNYPVVCMDESPKQLIGETKIPIPMSPGNVAKHDYKYKRNGTCSIFLASEPLSGKRLIKVNPRCTKKDWAYFLKDIAALYPSVKKIILVMDNLNTHTPSSLYETFAPVYVNVVVDKFLYSFITKHITPYNL